MKINLQSVNFNAKSNLLEYAEKKLSKLEQFYDKILAADVFLKLDNSAEKNNKIVEVKIDIPGNVIVVKKLGRTFEEGIDLVEDTLKKMIKRKKEKTSSH